MNKLLCSPNVNEKATISEVLKKLQEYKDILLDVPKEILPSLTEQYKIIENVHVDYSLFPLIKDIHTAVNRLSALERAIVIKKYCTTEKIFDYEVFNDLGISHRKFYILRKEALLNLARILKITIYRTPEEVPFE